MIIVAISLDCMAFFEKKIAMQSKIIADKNKFNQVGENDPSIFLSSISNRLNR